MSPGWTVLAGWTGAGADGRAPPRPACRFRAPVAAAARPGSDRVPGMAVQAPGLDNRGTGPSVAVPIAAGGLRCMRKGTPRSWRKMPPQDLLACCGSCGLRPA
jgi:hypothetical protein